MKKWGLLTGLAIAGSLLFCVASSPAKIPEPDNIIYGTLSVNGQPVTSGLLALKLSGSADTLASYAPGSNTGTGSAFILRVPIDSGDQRTAGTGRPGDLASIYLDDRLVATVTLGARGSVMKVPLQTCSALTDFYPDADHDGYPGGPAVSSCIRPAGFKAGHELISLVRDCNDNDASIHPGAAEVCNGKDDNCNGLVDESGDIPFYRDADGDGYGNPLVTIFACMAPAGYVSNARDCNDSSSEEHPGQIWYKDSDNDGYSDMTMNKTSCRRPNGYKTASGLTGMLKDCNDRVASIHPGAVELCDKIDNNCDGIVDNDCVSGAGKMCRNSHYLKLKDWILNAYSVRDVSGLYTIYLRVVTTGGLTPTAAGMAVNPLQVAADATAADVTLLYDEGESTAYVVYSNAGGEILRRVPLAIQ